MTSASATKPQTSSRNSRRTWIRTGVIAVAIIGAAAGFAFWQISAQSVYVDTSSIVAPEIALSPSQSGVLQEVFVQEGDQIDANAAVARVGNQIIKSKVAGIVVSVPETIGAQIAPNQAVVTMIDPTQLRVVGQVDENKGLDRIRVGDPVKFTVDAFGSKQYSAVIDEVSPASKESSVVFTISDQREEKQFDVKARFDITAYPELKNGMSARMWIYSQ